jgi:hypothetical protein
MSSISMNAVKIALRIWCGIVAFFLIFSLLFSITAFIETIEDKELQDSLPNIVYVVKPLKYCDVLFSVLGAVLLTEPIKLLRVSWIPAITLIPVIFSCLIYGISMLAWGIGAANGPHQIYPAQLIGNGLIFAGLLGSLLLQIRNLLTNFKKEQNDTSQP